MYLSWVIPCYNEEKRIEKTVRETDAYLRGKNFTEGYEIIVSDSFSTDRTAEIVEKLKEEIPSLKLFRIQNKGKGLAVKYGMLRAAGNLRIFADADNSVSPEHLDKFLPFICGKGGDPRVCFDAVIGSIELPEAEIEERAQWYRRFLGKLSKYVIRAVSGLWRIRDSQRGFKLFTAKAAEFIFPKQTILGWGFDIEILLIAERNGFKIKELPVRWVNPPDSKVNLGAYFSTFKELLRIKINDLRGRYRG